MDDTTVDLDIIREAAALLRHRTQRATPTPWGRDGLSSVEDSVSTFHRVGTATPRHAPVGHHSRRHRVMDAVTLTNTQTDAEHIAALANTATDLLEWLEAFAGPTYCYGSREGAYAERIARRYLDSQ